LREKFLTKEKIMDRIDHNATVLKVSSVSSEVAEVVFHCSSVASSAKPGQFVMVRLPGILDPLLGRPFAIAATEADTITVLFQIVGKFTNLLATLPPGTKATLRGPIGNGYLEKPSGKKILFVAGTLGAAPLLFALQCFPELKSHEFVLGIPGEGWEGFARYVKEKTSNLKVCSDDGTIGLKGNVLVALPDRLERDQEIWTCGPFPMLKAITQKYNDQGDQVRVSLDMKMACGIGGCLGCVITTAKGPKRVCVDGPFFLAGEVDWNDVE
jgi:dihydroorotate dehydrogenase electron transfer subunit